MVPLMHPPASPPRHDADDVCGCMSWTVDRQACLSTQSCSYTHHVDSVDRHAHLSTWSCSHTHHVDRHDSQPFTGSSSHTHMVVVGGGRKGFGRLKPSATGSEPKLNLLNPNLGVWFEVWQTSEPNLFCGFRFRSKVPEPAPNRTADSLGMYAIRESSRIHM